MLGVPNTSSDSSRQGCDVDMAVWLALFTEGDMRLTEGRDLLRPQDHQTQLSPVLLPWGAPRKTLPKLRSLGRICSSS